MKKTIALILINLTLNAQNEDKVVYQKDGLFVIQKQESNEHPDAKLTLNKLVSNQNNKELLAVFNVENYTLKASSQNNLTGLCANSGDGQHIHFIVNNRPYKALYEPYTKWQEEDGSYTLLAFLSRSHHQSIKTKDAFVLVNFTKGKKSKSANLSDPHLFYSRPKGTYVDDDMKEIMLDFFIVNCDLSKNGYKVRVELDNTHIFEINKWSAHTIKGLTEGEHLIRLTLLDSNGNKVKSPFNSETRKFRAMSNPK